VISFADEEGARFNTPTFGSKALTGKLDLPAVLDRRDEHGISVGEAMREAGVDPAAIAAAPGWLQRLKGFCEIHIDQCQDVARAGVPLAVVSALAGRMRLEVDVRGQADHSGTTPPHDRHDALAAAARVIVAAQEHGRAASGPRVTTARMLIEPNAATTIASHVRLWVDCRDRDLERLERLRGELESEAGAIARKERVEIALELASRSESREFDSGLRGRLSAAAEAIVGQPVPEHVCYAGHDAGVLAERIPAAMLLVRNPTGVSHSPAEHVALEDAAVAATVVLTALEEQG
jgi:N-carbamoyl-L-amino-acid hydrolase